MATYLWSCGNCKCEFEVWSTIAQRNDAPLHCGVPAARLINAPMVAPTFESYRAVGGDRRYIRTKQEHKGFLRDFGYEEVGNDMSYYPTETDAERETRERAVYEDVKQIEHAPTD